MIFLPHYSSVLGLSLFLVAHLSSSCRQETNALSLVDFLHLHQTTLEFDWSSSTRLKHPQTSCFGPAVFAAAQMDCTKEEIAPGLDLTGLNTAYVRVPLRFGLN